MIALIQLRPQAAGEVGVECLESLPEPPALRWSAFLVDCTDKLSIDTLVQWCAAAHKARPALPVGIVVRPDADTFRAVTSQRVEFRPVLLPDDLPDRLVGTVLIEQLRQDSVAARIVEHWLERYGRVSAPKLSLLHALAGHAARGERTKRVWVSTGSSLSTIDRRLRAWGYPTPGVLLRGGRLASVDLRIEAGVDPGAARAAAGWHSAEAYYKARKRFRGELAVGRAR